MLIACAFTMTEAPTTSALEYEEVPAKVEPAPIAAGLPIRGDSQAIDSGRRTFSFSVLSGFCLGEPKPRLDHVRVIERPKTASRSFKSTVVTAFLLHPSYLRAIPPSPAPPNVVYNACAGLGLIMEKRIKLRRAAADLVFYDGSYSPPRRVWPPPGRRHRPILMGREGVAPEAVHRVRIGPTAPITSKEFG